MPKVARELDVSAGQVGLLITVFTLPGVVLTPIWGVLSDRYGRKRVLVPSLILFGLAGGACALARDFELLLGLRLLQSVGAALGTINITIVGDLYAGRERTAALGYNYQRPEHRHGGLPGHRRRFGDARLVLTRSRSPSWRSPSVSWSSSHCTTPSPPARGT